VTRLRILRRRATHAGIVAESGALELIAQRIETNVRALQGALIRLIAFSSLTERPITSEMAAHVLDGLYPIGDPKGRLQTRSVIWRGLRYPGPER